MPTYSAKAPRPPITVAIVMFERTKFIDFCGPLQVFNDAQTPEGQPAYTVELVSPFGGMVETDTGAWLSTGAIGAFSKRHWDTVLVSGGSAAYEAASSSDLQRHLAAIAPHCRRLGSVCLGAFILAAGGHLNRHRATTHWEGCGQLADTYPDIRVQEDAIYVADGGVWTSAGVTCGIDMALAMVEQDLGQAEALRLAKSFVLPARRAGGQKQFSSALKAQFDSSETRFSQLVSEILDDPTQDLSVPRLAAMARMSDRHFARLFTETMGESPGRFVETLRVERACELIHQSDADLKVIAGLAGFRTQEQMRRSFQRIRGASPTDYRTKFGAREGGVG